MSKTYLVRGYYPGVGYRFWYSSSSTDLFLDYPAPDSYYPSNDGTYEDVLLYDVVVRGSGTLSDGYSLIDATQVANFTGSFVAGEPLALTPAGLEKARADTHSTVYGLAAVSGTATAGLTIIPVILSGICDTGNLGIPSLSWVIGSELYLETVAMGEEGVTDDIATLSSTPAISIIKLGTWSDINTIAVSISFILYTG
jgi:hypothetical protein